MKLGQVIKKEREKRGRTLDEMAVGVGLSAADYGRIEAGESPLEEWGMFLAKVAIELGVPMSRLLDEEGPYGTPRPGSCHRLLRAAREKAGLADEELAKKIDFPLERYRNVEKGDASLEEWGPRLLRCAQVIEQPIFNFVFPCGLRYDTLDDYP